jgi:uncharacterized protein (DUF1778 family)
MAGRPQKDKGERRDDTLRIRVTQAERRVLEGAATGKGLDMSAWARMVLLESAKKK